MCQTGAVPEVEEVLRGERGAGEAVAGDDGHARHPGPASTATTRDVGGQIERPCAAAWVCGAITRVQSSALRAGDALTASSTAMRSSARRLTMLTE